jgi:hypothetical protein
MLEWGVGGPWGGIVLRPGPFPDALVLTIPSGMARVVARARAIR